MTGRNIKKRHNIALAVFAALNSMSAAQAACVSLTTLGVAYTENFNSLASSGTGTLSIAGWAMLETGTNANTTYTAGTGSDNAGNTYSFGSAAVPADRALGGLRSGSLVPSFGACFTNNTGSTITSLPIAYNGEQWRAGVLNRGSADRIDFQYSTTATDLSAATGWIDVNALDFNSPNLAAAVGALDGNAAGNRTAVSSTISSLSIANGATFWIRWTDFDISGSDDGLAVDDFSLTPNGTVGNPTVNLSVSANTGSEAGATVITVTATASAAVTSDQTVSLAVTGTGITADDYSLSNATLTIPSGQTTGSVTFTVVDDALVEGTETATLTISNPSSGVTLGSTVAQNVTITDNDVPPAPTVNLSVSSNSGSEATATAITVTATAAFAVSGNQTIDLGVTGTGITAGDYSLSNTTITIPSGLTSGSVTFTVVDDALVEGAETATLTISNPSSGVTLGSTVAQNITITDNDSAALTPVYQIQGGGAASPIVGQSVTTSGIVTKLNNNGFYLQDPTGDGNANTSDGILVFTSTAPTVSVGQSIRVSGTVTEFNTGAAANADTLAHTVTELTSPTGITVLSAGNPLPSPTTVTLPEAVNDDLEKVEGMLVRLTGPLTASQNFFLGRYGQVTLSVGGRMENPTNKYRPGAQANLLADENARRRIILDDGTTVQNPNPTPYISAVDNTLRAGDTTTSITGVIDYGLATSDNTGFGDYKIHPTQTVTFTRANPRTATPEVVGGNVKVASFNVLNYFTTFQDGNTASGQSGQGCSLGASVSASNCRGANNSAEFTRQRNKIIAAIQAINADVVGLMEIQNNGNTAAQNLVDGLNTAMGANTYAALPLPAAGTGTDAIRVAMIYKPATVTQVGSPLSDTNAINNRPPLLQTFQAQNNEQFTVVVNHLKSKSSCPTAGSDAPNEDSGDGQGCWNNQRVQQAQRLRSWLSTNGITDALLIGDFNAYGQEDPIFDLTSNGFVDQSGLFENPGYSYVFDGAAGRLDHAITTASLSPKVSSVKHWHINADEPSVIDYNVEFKQPACGTCGPDYYVANPYRSSDHDPVVVGLNLTTGFNAITDTGNVNILAGTIGRDRLTGLTGRDTLTGNIDHDEFVYTSVMDGIDTLTDFTPNVDKIVLTGLLQGLGVNSANPLASGHVVCTASGTANSLISIDPDGSAGPSPKRSMIVVNGVSCQALAVPANFTF
ncbi:MAG: ExeM/NucH family extracellular endonuclease [Candidatus Methylumidiphilus sp.]